MLAGVLFLVFAGHLAVTYARHFNQGPAFQRSPDVNAIAGWMTLPYIARAYGVPEQALLAAVHLTAPEARHRSLGDIARSQHKPPEQVIAAVRAAVLAYRRALTPTLSAAPTPQARPPGGG